MTIDSKDQIHELAAIQEEYIHDGLLVGDDLDTQGWVRGTVKGFEIDEEDDQLDVLIQLPWGEVHRYGYDVDNIMNNNFKKLCKTYDRKVSEFEMINGEDIWLKVRYLNIEDGEIDSGTRINYRKVHTGPEHLKRQLKVVLSVVVVVVLLMVLFP